MDRNSRHASVHTCLDKSVVDSEGQPTGEISDLLLDCHTGHIDFVRVAVTPSAASDGRPPAAGDRRFVTIPWSALQVPASSDESWTVRASRETLCKMARYAVDSL